VAHKREIVSRIKGALVAGLGPKLLAYWTGLPEKTIERWKAGTDRGDVPPDEKVAAEIREALMGKFMGRESGR
jgi:hypothetical protein